MASAQLASPLRAINIKKLSDFASLRDACVGSCEKKNNKPQTMPLPRSIRVHAARNPD